MKTNPAVNALLGVAIGDAVGVPFEFLDHHQIKQNPAKDMVGYGTHHQPPGTWSDDSSLTFCLAESLVNGYDLADMAAKFIAWKEKNYWTAHNNLFDIGITTSHAITKLKSLLLLNKQDVLAELNYGADEMSNGNGSLMRIMPLLFYIKGKDIEEQFRIIWEVSALTHGHIRAAMCCLIYLKIAEYILNGFGKEESYTKTRKDIQDFWIQMDFAEIEQEHFQRFIQADICTLEYGDLKSGGYVMESIEASIWCFLQEDTYEKAILSAVNLGHDTDTTAAITGGLAGLFYGTENMPEFWIVSIARMEDIIDLGNKLYEKYGPIIL